VSDETLIAWCDKTWSPWLGCRKVSPGCDHCYITSTTPFRVRGIVHGKRRDELSEAYWRQPYTWERKAKRDGTHPKVFPSLCDPFDREVPIQWLADFVRVILDTPNLRWLLLTKRPQLIQSRMLDAAACLDLQWDGFPDNVWLGVSCENQECADKRIPILRSIPARIRFLSVEPMLEAIDLKLPHRDAPGASIDWVIFGGESQERGQNYARPFHLDWLRSGISQCQSTGVRVLVKQLGSHPVRDMSDVIPASDISDPNLDAADIGAWEYHRHNSPLHLKHPKGTDRNDWPEDVRIEEFPA